MSLFLLPPVYILLLSRSNGVIPRKRCLTAHLEGASLKNALQALVKYLGRFRDPKSAEASGSPNLKDDYSTCTSLADIVDTVLLQSYIKLGDSTSAQELLNSPNCCHIKECEKVLAAYQVCRRTLQLSFSTVFLSDSLFRNSTS